MIPRDDVVGHHIKEIVGDSTMSDDSFCCTDFIFILDNGVALRMPYDDETDDYLPLATVTPNHRPLEWPPTKQQHYHDKLWTATVADILIPLDCEERFPDSGIIKLSSGWFVSQMSGAPVGIGSGVRVDIELTNAESMISVWKAMANEATN